MKALLNWRYYVLMVVGMIAVIGTFSVPIDDQPFGAWQLQSRVPTDDEIRSRGTTYAVTHK